MGSQQDLSLQLAEPQPGTMSENATAFLVIILSIVISFLY
ncbi:hypothetical protein HMPREF9136_1794 [Prevotella dentalis DSM 3688]|uniref:Uncharacterized protein n=1 Tax=Prevotella dentalis (strain ATCC 49559 / DSM 3688 / JCM 13448 / NCTC 12043 / ES 2772) TaxID=908937 RepID=F9D4L6_PREDD|nr:hypothetical protein HMPREF9136_1794 [Prevotella dentalis DSM 3688]